MRRGLRAWLLLAACVPLALAVGATWLLTSGGGRDWALARLSAQLPAGTTLRIDALQGALLGPLEARGVHYVDAHGRVDIARLHLEHGLLPLLRGHWRVHRLWLDGVVVRREPATAAAPPPRWPDLLPRWSLPLTIDVDDLRVRGLSLGRAGAPTTVLARLDGAGTLGDGALILHRLRAAAAEGEVTLSGRYVPRARFRSDLRLEAQWRPSPGGAPVPVHARLLGDLRAATLSATAGGAAPLRLQATLRDGDAAVPTWRLALESPGLDTAAFGLAATHALAGAVSLEGLGGDARVAARGVVDGRTFGIAPATLHLGQESVQLSALTLRLDEGALTLDGQIGWRRAAPTADLRLRSDAWRLPARAGGTDVLAAGALRVHGAVDDWRLEGELRFRRARAQATLSIAAHGNRERAQLTRADALTPAGRLQASGSVAWAPQPQVDGVVRA
ncbi:MAG TPA: hypothetical protein VF291_05520, partial [Burkholderiaceae bacterium]